MESFERIERVAVVYLNRFTFGRISELVYVPDSIKICLCEMCETIHEMTNDSREKKSESTDGYSVTYVTERADGQSADSLLKKKLYQIADLYVADMGLLSYEVE